MPFQTKWSLEHKEILTFTQKLSQEILNEACLANLQNMDELILCHSCYNKLRKNKFPSMNVNNGLQLDDVPDELACLTDLEQQLIAPLLLFMKIKKLPTTRMGAIVDRVISVPIQNEDVSR